MGGTLSSGGWIGPAGWLVLAVLAGAPTGVRAADPAGPVVDIPGVPMRNEVFEVERVLDGAGRVERRLVPAVDLVAGDELRYVIVLRNDTGARIEAGRVQVQTGVPAGTEFLPGSAGGAGALVEYSVVDGSFSTNLPELRAAAAPPPSADAVDPAPAAALAVASPMAAVDMAAGVDSAGTPALATAMPGGGTVDSHADLLTIRWTYQQPMEPGAEAQMFFHVRLE